MTRRGTVNLPGRSASAEAGGSLQRRFRAAILLIPVGIRIVFWAYRGLASGYDFEPVEGGLLFIGFLAWLLVPYVLLVRLARRSHPRALLSAGAAMSAVEALAHFQVFILRGTAMDSLLFVVLPVIQVLLVMPAGFAFGTMVERFAIPRKGEDRPEATVR